MKSALITILLLVISNVFMTFAWYGHLKLQSANIEVLAPYCRDTLLMGVGLLGILLYGAGQPDGIPRERRTILSLRTQNNPGGGDVDNLYCGGYVAISR